MTSSFAWRRISPGEEIRSDYSTTMGDDPETMACRCGERVCRGLVEDFHRLPELVKSLYIGERAFQSFIAHNCRTLVALPELRMEDCKATDCAV